MTEVYKPHPASISSLPKKKVFVAAAAASFPISAVAEDPRAETPGSNDGRVKNGLLSQLQLESLSAQVERLRVAQRERDIEITKLKGENSMLKQRERRNQRDLESLEQETAEAPLVIKRLKDEVTAARAKVKTYYAQIGDDSRLIRQMHDEHLKQKQTIAKLETLVSQKNLAGRDALAAELAEANAKVGELQKLWAESERKLEIVDRNLNIDNRYLRGKIAAMDKEKELVRIQLREYEENIKEKEKVIASLSIYRYNAIHRKQDAGCKICNKREKEEAEVKKKQDLIAQLPEFEMKKIKVTSATSIEFQLQFAKEYEADRKFTYSQLRLLYSTDPNMTEGVQKKKLDAASFLKASDFVFKSDGFTSGLVYYCAVVSGYQDVFGYTPSPKQLLIDAIPNPPKILNTTVLHNPPGIQIHFQAPEHNKSSKVLLYKVYQSNTPDFADQYLALDLPSEIFEFTPESMSITISEPHTAVPYYFKLSATNIKGESMLSEASLETIIDYVPEKPTKPIVKRLSARSIHVTAIASPGAGTFASKFRITTSRCPKVTNAMPSVSSESRQESSEIVPATIHISGKREMHYTLVDVDPLQSYTFSVVAINSTGVSEASEWSDDIDIDYLVPALTDLKVSVMSASSFTVTAPSSKDIKLPPILGFRVHWATNYDMTENLRSSAVLPCDMKSHLFDGLQEGEIIYVTACLVGEEEEGMPCKPTFVPLATSIPLPSSPFPQNGSDSPRTSDAPPPDILKKTASSRLSIHENANMQFGYSAYHEPPAPRAKRQPTLKRSITSLDARSSLTSLRGGKSKVTIQTRSNTTARKLSDPGRRSLTTSRSGSLPQINK